MSNIYSLTKNLHEIVQEKAKKFGKEIKIESNKYYVEHHKNDEINGVELYYIPEAPQIRQILIAFQDELGDNQVFLKFYKRAGVTYDISNNLLGVEDGNGNWYEMSPEEWGLSPIPKSQAEALCHRWLDGLEPLFDRESETVLQELINVLKKICSIKL